MDNITYAQTFNSMPFSEIFFGMPSWLRIVIPIAFVVAFSLGIWLATRSRILSYLSFMVCLIILAFTRIIPIWLLGTGILMALATVFIGGGSVNPTSDSTNILNSFSWLRYGARMKRAYASKFGGENQGYNEEVDARIAIMRTQGKGDTRTLAQDWLRRNAKFVEIPWRDLNDEVSETESNKSP